MTATTRISEQERHLDRGTRRPEILAWMRLARIYHKIDRATADRLRRHELSVAQLDVLAQIGAREGITQKELASALLVTKGNVCQLLDRMEARGLVERRTARNERGNHLYLTEDGRRLRCTAVPSHQQLVVERFAGLTPAEHRQLLALLRKLDQSLDHPEED
ncbi:MAG TPA: MarR family transcriptional regulator [Thermomicrobiales bacterium]|jgi:DNA-binding MarR family transcriptional regulator